MSEEEKKAIEILSIFLKENNEFECQECGFNQNEEQKALNIILNLIEKKQKEIEKLKKLDISNNKIIKNMRVRHYRDREKIRNSIRISICKDEIIDLIEKYENEIEKDGVLTKTNQYNLLRAVINDLDEVLE